MDADELLFSIREAVKTWYDSPIEEGHDAAKAVITIWQDIDTWMTTGGPLPEGWTLERRTDNPEMASLQPDHERDAFIIPRTGAVALVIDGTKCGTYAHAEQAIMAAHKRMSDMDYWPYLWLTADNGMPRLIDSISDRLADPANEWWWCSREKKSDFEFVPIEPVAGEKVQAMQREANDQNSRRGWQKNRLMRKLRVRT